MTDRVIAKFIAQAKNSLNEIANSAMIFPKEEPFHHGIQVGRHQGLRHALEILEEILGAEDDEEFKS